MIIQSTNVDTKSQIWNFLDSWIDLHLFKYYTIALHSVGGPDQGYGSAGGGQAGQSSIVGGSNRGHPNTNEQLNGRLGPTGIFCFVNQIWNLCI